MNYTKFKYYRWQETKHINQAIHRDLEAQGKRYEKSKTGEPLAPEKGLMSFKIHF